jgi:hypothetical protein
MAWIRGRRLGVASAALGLAAGTMAGAVHASAAPVGAACLRACSAASAAAAPAIMQLNGVSASSSSSAWAVGTWSRTAAGYKVLIEHWTGGRWQYLPGRSPGNDSNTLNGVVALSRSQAWAVGDYHTNGQSLKTLVEHWNGKSWAVQPSPSPVKGNNTLVSVAATSSSNAWAVGHTLSTTGEQRTLIEHWNGRSWAVQRSPSPSSSSQLTAVAVVSRTNVWAVGYSDSSDGTTTKTLIEHWNGSSWKIQTSPNPSVTQNYLCGVDATSGSNAWTSGMYVEAGFQGPLMEHWNGKSWSIHASARQPSGYEYDPCSIFALSSSNIWAVGSRWYLNADHTLIEHWNGSTWKVQASPNPAGGDMDENVLNGVIATSATNAWAAGWSYVRNSGHKKALIEHWNGFTWKLQTAALPG